MLILGEYSHVEGKKWLFSNSYMESKIEVSIRGLPFKCIWALGKSECYHWGWGWDGQAIEKEADISLNKFYYTVSCYLKLLIGSVTKVKQHITEPILPQFN